MFLPYNSFSEVISQNTYIREYVCICVCVHIALFSIPLMEGHTEIEQILGPVIFWDCLQHKEVTKL